MAIHKLKRVGVIGETAERRADFAAQDGHERGGKFAPVFQRLRFRAAKNRFAFRGNGLCHVLPDAVNHAQGLQITFAACVAPCEDAVRTENDSVRAGIVFVRVFQPQAEFKAGTFPGKPDKISTPSLHAEFCLIASGPLAQAAIAIAQSGCR